MSLSAVITRVPLLKQMVISKNKQANKPANKDVWIVFLKSKENLVDMIKID